MKKKLLLSLLTLGIISTLSSSTVVFAKESSATINSNVEQSLLTQSMSNKDFILNNGHVLSYNDFSEILSECKENNIELTNNTAEKMIIEKINSKLNRNLTMSAISTSGFYDDVTLTQAEVALATIYPVQAITAYDDSRTALSEAQRLYQDSTLYLGNGDAFRHTYWNALMTFDVGSNLAKAFADAHESETADGVDKTMDLNNNNIGRNLVSQCSRSNCESIVISFCDNGWLYRVINNSLTCTDGTGKR